jgi:aspartate aminotransferase
MALPQLSAHMAARQPSAIRVASIRFAQRTDGAKALNVAIGNVSLPMHPAMRQRLASLGQPDGPMADGVVRYTATVGTDEAIAAVKNVIAASLPEDKAARAQNLHVQITDGGSQAMELLILACCGPAGSDERPLLLIDAAYTNYLAFAERLGRKVVSVRRQLTPDGRFPLPDTDTLEAAFTKHRPGAAVIIPFDNPTGALYRKEDLATLARLCVKHNCWLVSDEAYRELHYTGEDAPSVWTLSEQDAPGIEGRRLAIETASKVWNACGLRIGALVTDNPTLHAQCVAENTASLCPSTIGQSIFGALSQENRQDLRAWFASQREYYKGMVEDFHHAMKEALPGCIVSRPEASIYSVIDVRDLVAPDFDSLEFVLWCASSGKVSTEQGPMTLLTAPMGGFYDISELSDNPGRTQFRVAFVEPPEIMAQVPALFAQLFQLYLQERKA